MIAIGEGLVFAYVIERLFAESRGLSVLEMQSLLTIYAVISAVLEIPCGALADRWKKKYVLAAGLFICYFEFVFSLFAYDFLGFSLAYLAAATGGSLKSGVAESILYMTLKEHGREPEFVKWQGRFQFTGGAVMGVCSLMGGYLASEYGLEITYWLSLAGLPLCAGAALLLEEPSSADSEVEKQLPVWKQVKSGIRSILKAKQLLQIVLISAIVYAVLQNELYEMSMLVYPEIGIPVLYFGVISFGIIGVSAVSNLASDWYAGTGLGLRTAFAAGAVCIFLFGFLQEWYAVFFAAAAIGFLELTSPIMAGLLQEQASDEYRVTAASVESLCANAMSIAIGTGFGAAAGAFGIQTAFQLLAVAAGGLVLARLQTK
nr:MFS transporter [Metabacillus mangrovi]